MTPEEQLTAVAETVIALEEAPPYTKSERESFMKASTFFREWGEVGFSAPDEMLDEDGVTREDAIEASQPILAVALELVRLAAGAQSTVPREALQSHVRELGQIAAEGFSQLAHEHMAPPTDERFQAQEEPDGYAFY